MNIFLQADYQLKNPIRKREKNSEKEDMLNLKLTQ